MIIDQVSRRQFLKQALSLGTATIIPAASILSDSNASPHKQRAILVWFAHLITRAASAGQTVDEKYVGSVMAQCASRGINTVYWQPRYVGAAIYRSKVVAPFDDSFQKLWEEGTPELTVNNVHRVQGTALADVLRRFDPYDTAIWESRRHRLKLIAQIQVFDHWFPILPDRFYEKHPELLLMDRTQKVHVKGLPCYAETSAQDYCLAEINELLERGAEGISLDLDSHQLNAWPAQLGEPRPDTLGFNPPLVKEYERRYGVDVLKQDFDPEKWHALHGDFFTRFLRRVKKLAGRRSLIVSTSVEGFLGLGGKARNIMLPNFGSQSPACWINLEWESWLREGTVDAVRVWAPEPHDVETVETLKRKSTRGKFYLGMLANVPGEIPRYRRQVGQMERGSVDGFIIHGYEDYEAVPQLWEAVQ